MLGHIRSRAEQALFFATPQGHADRAARPRADGHASATRSRRFARALRLADAFSCGNEHLAGFCRSAGRPVLVAPSPVPLDVPRAAPGRRGDPLRIGWLGSAVNLHELEAFVELCAGLGADRMVLRPLNYNEATELDWERGGHHFKYADELLPWDELVRVSGRAAELCRRHGVELSDQMDFGGAMETGFPEEYERGRREAGAAAPAAAATVPGLHVEGAPAAPETGHGNGHPAALAAAEPPSSLGEERLPLCTEPWKSLYILRRGILPCCYGSRPLAPMDAYAETWNSQELQDIRRELAAGRFHEYCLASEACPIVRKSAHGRALTRADRAFQAAKRVWQRADRVAFGVPGRLLRPVKGQLAGLTRRAAGLLAR